MDFYDAFNETLHRFDIKAVDLAQETGLSMQRISQFKKGQNIRVEDLQKLLGAMPQEAKRYMLTLVAEGESD
ncbi:helix-turn-helix domain-containing protein [Nodosilinea sp. LEGE 06152]|uniref:helix-turn-helix domain-containing protein n=1 Tax=Nodosilinea sp. LEGE 06152 TaxID=2777966 RepID=UPI001882C60F|nr:helix-turn-helix domain-containing protein [Nodosilinea sp. LEGE 06152]MBE9160667.1 helix-turn-helix domain-containing protein [Nodosilinea sp. LEGE 06152]